MIVDRLGSPMRDDLRRELGDTRGCPREEVVGHLDGVHVHVSPPRGRGSHDIGRGELVVHTRDDVRGSGIERGDVGIVGE